MCLLETFLDDCKSMKVTLSVVIYLTDDIPCSLEEVLIFVLLYQ